MNSATNLDRACRVFGWGGGTIHEVALQVAKPGRGNELALMPPDEFERLLLAYFNSNEDQPWKRIGL